MKVKIITFHRGTNYGAFLQAWSLRQYLRQTIDCDVEIFDYQSDAARLAEKKVFLPRWKRDLFDLVILRRTLKYLKFKYWQWKYFGVGFKPNSELINLNADIVVFGSDEIWNVSNWYRTVDYNFFGFNLNNKIRKLAYAPSMGSSKLESFEDDEKIIRSLDAFENILVRDFNTKGILDELQFKSDVVLDPTFLINWDTILENYTRPTNKKYILLNINQTDDFGPILKLIKQRIRWKSYEIINLTYTKEIKGVKNVNSPGPFKWVVYFKYAERVITDTFHGTVFALNTRSQFTVFNPGEKRNKINGVLGLLGLNMSFLCNEEDLGLLEESVDYSSISGNIRNRIAQSKQLLNNNFT